MIRTPTIPRATVADLYKEEGKAELIGGRIVRYMATGSRPTRVAARIAVAIEAQARKIGRGVGFTDGIGFVVPELSSGRESFGPDAAYFAGQDDDGDDDFIDGPPTFAVEVRSKSDHGPAADREYAAKRADYFEAGTLVVWDVDPLAETVTAYRADAPDAPTVFGPGHAATAEPALPGWSLPLVDIFG